MQHIAVYVDEGVSGPSLRHLVKSLKQEIGKEDYSLKRLDAEAIKKGEWEGETALLIIPGGRDLFYHEKLGKEGAGRIRKFVERGGSYLGICAGGYFGASEIEFEKGGRLEVCGKRRLRLFSGAAMGPAYGKHHYCYNSEKGAEAALISWKHTISAFTYFNGGCFFKALPNDPNVEVLARYLEVEDTPAAIIRCKVGEGRAILSGVHLEYSAAALVKGNPYLDRIYPLLNKTEERRREIFRDVLSMSQISNSRLKFFV